MPQVYRAIRPMFQTNQWRIFPDDIVQVLSGPEKGSTGRVLTLIKDRRRPEVIVEGLNLRKKKVQTGTKKDEFFVVTMEAPLHYTNVMLVDPVSKQPVRTIFRYLPNGTKVRLGVGANASEQVIPIPLVKEDTSKHGLCGKKDTTQEEALRVTYDPLAPFPFQQPATRPSRLPYPDMLLGPSERAPRPLRPSTGPWASPPWMVMMGMPQPSSPEPPPLHATAGVKHYSTALRGLEMSQRCNQPQT